MARVGKIGGENDEGFRETVRSLWELQAVPVGTSRIPLGKSTRKLVAPTTVNRTVATGEPALRDERRYRDPRPAAAAVNSMASGSQQRTSVRLASSNCYSRT
jgi:hypothetical protein